MMNNLLKISTPTFSDRLKWVRNGKKHPLLISFFCGQGNGDLAAQQAEFVTSLAFDWDKHKCTTFGLNFPSTRIEQHDLFTTSPADILSLIENMGIKRGSYGCMFATPCPGLSHDGPKDPFDPRNRLLVEVTPKLIKELQPEFFIIEQVPALTQGRNKKIYWVLRKRLDAIENYTWDYREMNSSHYPGIDGNPAPQARVRWVAIGLRNDISTTVEFPIPDTSKKEWCRVENVAPQITKFYTGRKFPEKKAKYSNCIMTTIMATPNVKADDTDGNKKRWLTIPELKTFFGVPQSFKTTGSFAKQWRGFGDAVCVPMFYAIFKHIKEKYLDPFDGGGNESPDNFPLVNPDPAPEIVSPTEVSPVIQVKEVVRVSDATGMQKNITLLGDCLAEMPRFLDHSFDMILTDPPYGVTDHPWDKIISPKLMWEQFKRLIKLDGAIVLFAQQPFTTDLINTNRKWFKYSMIWQKNKATGHLNAKVQPLRNHEEMLVFYKKHPYYNPQKTPVQKVSGYEPTDRYPVTVMTYAKDQPQLHPTQKPLALVKTLVETFTRPGELILDCCAGCGTTGLAAKNTGRQYVQIERDPKFYEIAKQRVNES